MPWWIDPHPWEGKTKKRDVGNPTGLEDLLRKKFGPMKVNPRRTLVDGTNFFT